MSDSSNSDNGQKQDELSLYLREAEKKGHINRVRPHLDPVIKERVLMKISLLLENAKPEKIYH